MMRNILFILFINFSAFTFGQSDTLRHLLPADTSQAAVSNPQHTDYIQGTIVDEEKQPMAFVPVMLMQGEQHISNTVSDVNGNYIIAVPDSLTDFTLVFAYIGMGKKTYHIIRTKTEKGGNSQ